MQSDLIRQNYETVGGCWGLVREVNRRLGCLLPEWAEVCADDAAAEIARRRHLFTPVQDPRPGDVVHVKTFDGPEHVGVIVAPGVMLQATRRHGIQSIRLDHPWCRDRILGIFRYAVA